MIMVKPEMRDGVFVLKSLSKARPKGAPEGFICCLSFMKASTFEVKMCFSRVLTRVVKVMYLLETFDISLMET